VPDGALAELLEVVPVMRARKAVLNSALGPSLLPRVVESRRTAYRARFAEVLGALDGRADLDFVESVAIPYGVRVAALTAGLPESSEEEVAAIFSPSGIDPALPFRVETAVADERLNAMVESLLASEAGLRCDDPESALALAARATGLSGEELRNGLVDVVVASLHGVAAGLNAAAILLASTPEQWESLQREPELASAAAEEILRVAVGRPFINRLVLADFEYADVRFERGDVICVFLAATNAIVRAGEPPRAFDIHAPRCPHLSFGRGPSFCAGSTTVRTVLVEALTGLTTRLERMELIAAPTRKLFAGREYIDSVPIRFTWR
jgi:cytochrome P450